MLAKIKVKYLNVYYHVTRKQEEYIEFDGRLTLGGLLTLVCRRHGPKLQEMVFDTEDQLKPHTWILVDQVRETNIGRELIDNEIVVFSLPIVGG